MNPEETQQVNPEQVMVYLGNGQLHFNNTFLYLLQQNAEVREHVLNLINTPIEELIIKDLTDTLEENTPINDPEVTPHVDDDYHTEAYRSE